MCFLFIVPTGVKVAAKDNRVFFNYNSFFVFFVFNSFFVFFVFIYFLLISYAFLNTLLSFL